MDSRINPQYALALDFDGPVFDARRAAKRALEDVIEEFRGLPVEALEVFESTPLTQSEGVIRSLFNDLNPGNSHFISVVSFYRQRLSHHEGKERVIDEVVLALSRAKSLGLGIGIYSSRKYNQIHKLAIQTGIISMLDIIIGSDLKENEKPSGKALVDIAQVLGVATENLIYVGDSDFDFVSAEKAGAQYYHAGWTGEPSYKGLSKPSVVFQTPRDLVDLVECMSVKLEGVETYDPGYFGECARDKKLVFFAGAGVSVPSGFLGWEEQYAGFFDLANLRSVAMYRDTTHCIELSVSTPDTRKRVFEKFKDTFGPGNKKPNRYHYGLLRSDVYRIWTSNYDNLFEDANISFDSKWKPIRSNQDVINESNLDRLLIKLNGDTTSARYEDSLDWDVVFTESQFDSAIESRPDIWRMLEDDYRYKLIIFIGVSFRDPSLRRIVHTARTKIRKTSFEHIIIQKMPYLVKFRKEAMLQAKNLERLGIKTIFVPSYEDVENFVGILCSSSKTSSIGISGSAIIFGKEQVDGNIFLTGSDMSILDMQQFSWELGRSLASSGFEVVSCGSPFVGIPAVQGAFDSSPARARFVLRKGGTSSLPRIAHTRIIDTTEYNIMRSEYIKSIDLLIAIGGAIDHDLDLGQSGVYQEIVMAICRNIPVVLIPHFGGVVKNHFDVIMSIVESEYTDTKLKQIVLDVNRKIKDIDVDELKGFSSVGIIDCLRMLISKSCLSYPVVN